MRLGQQLASAARRVVQELAGASNHMRRWRRYRMEILPMTGDTVNRPKVHLNPTLSMASPAVSGPTNSELAIARASHENYAAAGPARPGLGRSEWRLVAA